MNPGGDLKLTRHWQDPTVDTGGPRLRRVSPLPAMASVSRPNPRFRFRSLFFKLGGAAMTRACDGCRTSNASMYCVPDMAYLCSACDAKVHGANKLAQRHERLWLCEVCEHSAATVVCRADAAALCASCDVDIHSANPLAGRHERVPLAPFLESPSLDLRVAHINAESVVPPAYDCMRAATGVAAEYPKVHLNPYDLLLGVQEQAAAAAASVSAAADGLIDAAPDGLIDAAAAGAAADPFLDISALSAPQSSSFGCFQSRSSAVVPESSSSMSEISNPFVMDYLQQQFLQHHQQQKEQQQPNQQDEGKTKMAREERVLRYREKKKNRKFEKTVRYASRKAYAEIRPRVKGRFVKRPSSTPSEVVGQFIIADSVVPSF